MTAEEIRERINVIETELFAESNYTSTCILSPDAARLSRDRNERLAALSRERAELYGKLPPTGMAAGHRVVIANVLGEINLSDWPMTEPADVRANHPVDLWDWSE